MLTRKIGEGGRWLLEKIVDAVASSGINEKEVCVEIADNGPGILPDIQPHIFEPFFTTKGVVEGTGLGLDTVQRIVKKHRENIQVTSKAGDTRFQVRLPLAEAMA